MLILLPLALVLNLKYLNYGMFMLCCNKLNEFSIVTTILNDMIIQKNIFQPNRHECCSYINENIINTQRIIFKLSKE